MKSMPTEVPPDEFHVQALFFLILNMASRLLKKFNARSILLMFSRVSRELKDADRRYWRGIWGIFASSSALQTDSSRGGDNFRDADEIAGRRRQDKEPFDQAAPAVTGLAQAADGLDPSEPAPRSAYA